MCCISIRYLRIGNPLGYDHALLITFLDYDILALANSILNASTIQLMILMNVIMHFFSKIGNTRLILSYLHADIYLFNQTVWFFFKSDETCLEMHPRTCFVQLSTDFIISQSLWDKMKNDYYYFIILKSCVE